MYPHKKYPPQKFTPTTGFVAATNTNRPPSANSRMLNFNVQGQGANSLRTQQPNSTDQPISLTGSSATSAQAPGSSQSSANNQIAKIDVAKLAASEEDERYRYLLKHGIVKRVEDEDKIIFAELQQIRGVLVVYRKPSERQQNPDRLNLDRRDLDHLPLLEGEEKLRLLNLQHNNISKIENLVSLPNLIFLDLYSNKIKEIIHLHTVPTLRVLMLGKNQIERIRNLQSLNKLDVLDLHSNKITKIQNINHLSELRVLNLANNNITAVENLQGLVSLTELNLRRNQIESVTGLHCCPKLQRIYLAHNNLEKLEKVSALKDAPSLTEVCLDGNPLYNQQLSTLTRFLVESCPNLIALDDLKLTSEVREQVIKAPDTEGVLPFLGKGSSLEAENKENKTSNIGATQLTQPTAVDTNALLSMSDATIEHQAPNPGISRPGLLNSVAAMQAQNSSSAAAAPPPRPFLSNPQSSAQNNPPASNDQDISPEKLLQVISEEWTNELERLRAKGLNGYKRRKEDKSESLVQSGHAEIEGDNLLFIYGNALEVLNNTEFQKSVEQISFQYVRFDYIVNHSNLGKLKRFQKLKKLIFLDNNIHSFIQISKLEALQALASISIENNDVANTTLCRTFIVYRFPNVTEINSCPVSDTDRLKARQQFQHFDKILSAQNLFSPIVIQKHVHEQLRQHEQAIGAAHSSHQSTQKALRSIQKKNLEAASNAINNIQQQAIVRDRKVEELDALYFHGFKDIILNALQEFKAGGTINETSLRSSVNL